MRTCLSRVTALLAIGATILAGAARAEPWPAPEPHGAEPSCLIMVYWDINYGGESWRVDPDTPWVGVHWNDQISSVKVISGVWDFYFDANYEGESFRTGPGWYPYVGDHWNDQISSFRCERPTPPVD